VKGTKKKNKRQREGPASSGTLSSRYIQITIPPWRGAWILQAEFLPVIPQASTIDNPPPPPRLSLSLYIYIYIYICICIMYTYICIYLEWLCPRDSMFKKHFPSLSDLTKNSVSQIPLRISFFPGFWNLSKKLTWSTLLLPFICQGNFASILRHFLFY